MAGARVFFWIIIAATVVVFGAMVFWAAPLIRGEAGLLLFDERFSYTHEEAEAFLAALSDDGRALYLLEMRLLDTLFPVLLALSLGIGIYRLSRGWSLLARLAAIVPPVLGAVFDFRENVAVAEMLRPWSDGLTPELAAEATFWTSMKWVMDLTAGATVIALVFSWLLARYLARGEGE